MKKLMVTALCAGVCCTIAFSAELLINGNFEDSLFLAWDSVHCIKAAPVDNYQIARGTGFIGDPDYEAKVSFRTDPSLRGSFKLYQVVSVKNLDLHKLTFSVDAKFETRGMEAMGIGAIIISYLDENHKRCGDTKIYSLDSSCVSDSFTKWPLDDNQSLFEVTDNSVHSYSYNILDEIEKINGFPADRVVYIEVAVMVFGECYG